MTLLSHYLLSIDYPRWGLSVRTACYTMGKSFQEEETSEDMCSLQRLQQFRFPSTSPTPIKGHSQLFPLADPSVSQGERLALPVCAGKHSPICWRSDSCPFSISCLCMLSSEIQQANSTFQGSRNISLLQVWAHHHPKHTLPCSPASLDRRACCLLWFQWTAVDSNKNL